MRDPDALLARSGVRPDTRSDQHFLVDDRVLDRLPGHLPDGWREASATGDGTHVLEIGAGTGALTDRLLATADHVTAIERDPDLADFLRREFDAERANDRLTVVEGDALEADLPDFDASVSNLPYGASSEFLFRLLPRRRPLVVTVQREFAERMVAEAGGEEYGRLSVTAGHYADCELVETVPPTAFDPPPAVESAVVRARPREPAYAVPEERRFLDLVRAVFTQRRKTMRNAVRNTVHISGLESETAEELVSRAGEELMGRRAGNVAPAEFARLAALSLAIEREAGEP